MIRRRAPLRRSRLRAERPARAFIAKRLRHRNQMPVWADERALRDVYWWARELRELTGIAHHVDHIIPLHGELVSGLHVAGNLRAVPADVNLEAGARFSPLSFDGP